MTDNNRNFPKIIQHTLIGIMPVIKDQITALRRHNA